MASVLVTGASRGIGRATAEHLSRRGWDVHAGVRGDVARAPLGTHPVRLDITDAADVEALANALPPRLDAVVNNAGFVVAGPLETVSPDDLRRQFEVNVVGHLAVTRAVLPRLRAARGRVVFLASVNGRLSTPMTGAYCASKFAVEGLADALRPELRPWGVRVSMIEPGPVDTDMLRTAPELVNETVARWPVEYRRLYARHVDGLRRAIPRVQRRGIPPEEIARYVERALTDRHPRARYTVGRDARLLVLLHGLAPAAVLDAALGRLIGIPRRPPG